MPRQAFYGGWSASSKRYRQDLSVIVICFVIVVIVVVLVVIVIGVIVVIVIGVIVVVLIIRSC